MVEEKLTGLVLDAMDINDLPEVVTIERASFTTPWSETSFFNEIKNPLSISRVARKGGSVIGYICAKRIMDEGHILTLAVSPEFRRLGIASALVEEIVKCLGQDDCRHIFLEVRASNKEAKRIYERFNFKLIGTRKNYYVSPVEDAVIMALKTDEKI